MAEEKASATSSFTLSPVNDFKKAVKHVVTDGCWVDDESIYC